MAAEGNSRMFPTLFTLEVYPSTKASPGTAPPPLLLLRTVTSRCTHYIPSFPASLFSPCPMVAPTCLTLPSPPPDSQLANQAFVRREQLAQLLRLKALPARPDEADKATASSHLQPPSLSLRAYDL